MTDLRRAVIDEAGSRSKYLTATEFLALVERGHPTDAPGVERETVVPESTLLDAMVTIGGVDRDTAKGNLEARRMDGTVVEDADQHPDANVFLAEERDDLTESKDVQ